MAASVTDDAAARVNRAVIDLRLLLLDARLRGERRRAVQDELEALRLARVGVRVNGQAAYLSRCGVTRNGRRARVVRGPREWGNRTAVHVAGR